MPRSSPTKSHGGRVMKKAKSTAGSVGKSESKRNSGSITLDHVAKLAGVSPITVSRVLNKPELVAARTAEKVQRAISLTGYVPNLLAGGLASRRSRLIAVVIPAITNPVYAETTGSLIERLGTVGYQVLLGESGFSPESEEKLLLAILSRQPDAVFLTGTMHSAETRRRLLNADIPTVEVWDISPTPLDVCVGFSHERVGRAVAEYFIEKGYRNVGIISATDPRAQVRQQEFIRVLQSHGIKNVPSCIVPAPPSFKHGRSGLVHLLENGFSNGAIFCSSDTLAHGALTEAMSKGLSVPADVALMGFADQSFAAHTFPPLSTVRIDKSEIGKRAAEAIIARIEGKTGIEKIIDVGFEVIERETS
jgi:LacI family gluconate utilization system Gnt-I transcriptional repressor